MTPRREWLLGLALSAATWACAGEPPKPIAPAVVIPTAPQAIANRDAAAGSASEAYETPIDRLRRRGTLHVEPLVFEGEALVLFGTKEIARAAWRTAGTTVVPVHGFPVGVKVIAQAQDDTFVYTLVESLAVFGQPAGLRGVHCMTKDLDHEDRHATAHCQHYRARGVTSESALSKLVGKSGTYDAADPDDVRGRAVIRAWKRRNTAKFEMQRAWQGVLLEAIDRRALEAGLRGALRPYCSSEVCVDDAATITMTPKGDIETATTFAWLNPLANPSGDALAKGEERVPWFLTLTGENERIVGTTLLESGISASVLADLGPDASNSLALAFATKSAALVFDTRLFVDPDSPRPLGDVIATKRGVLYYQRATTDLPPCAAVFSTGTQLPESRRNGQAVADFEDSLIAAKAPDAEAAVRALAQSAAQGSIPKAEACALITAAHAKGGLARVASRDAAVLVYDQPMRPYCGTRLLQATDPEAAAEFERLTSVRCSALSCSGATCDMPDCFAGQECLGGPGWSYFTFVKEKSKGAERWKISGFASYGGS